MHWGELVVAKLGYELSTDFSSTHTCQGKTLNLRLNIMFIIWVLAIVTVDFLFFSSWMNFLAFALAFAHCTRTAYHGILHTVYQVCDVGFLTNAVHAEKGKKQNWGTQRVIKLTHRINACCRTYIQHPNEHTAPPGVRMSQQQLILPPRTGTRAHRKRSLLGKISPRPFAFSLVRIRPQRVRQRYLGVLNGYPCYGT